MNVSFMVSFAGLDRANLLTDLAQFTHDNEGKWLSSKVSYLEGHVAANIKVSLPAEKARIVKAKLAKHKHKHRAITWAWNCLLHQAPTSGAERKTTNSLLKLNVFSELCLS